MSRFADVAVSGVGCITPLGNNPEAATDSYLQGLSGCSELSASWASGLSARIVAPVCCDTEELLGEFLVNRLDRCSQLALLAAFTLIGSLLELPLEPNPPR